MPKKAKKAGTGPTRKVSSGAHKGKRPSRTYEQPEVDSLIQEPAIEYTTKIRALGNSKGVILNNPLLDMANLGQDIVIRAIKGLITIERAKKPGVNTDLSAWEKHLKAAIKAGDKPEGDLFEGMENKFDKTEW